MSNLSMSIPASFQKALEMLNSKPSRKIGPNTRLTADNDGCIKVIYHNTAIIRLNPDNTWAINNGGFYTVTTKERLNLFLRQHGIYLRQRKGAWFIGSVNAMQDEIEFKNGFNSSTLRINK